MLVRVRVCVNGSLHVLVINRCCSLLACLLLLLASWIVVILLAWRCSLGAHGIHHTSNLIHQVPLRESTAAWILVVSHRLRAIRTAANNNNTWWWWQQTKVK